MPPQVPARFPRWIPRRDLRRLGARLELAAHERWDAQLGRGELRALINAGEFAEVGRRATSIESRAHLLFSFEKMALRDAVKPPEGARAFAEGLWEFLHGRGSDASRSAAWVECLAGL